MSDSPLISFIIFAGALYLAKLWRDDLLLAKAGNPNPRALPGATSVPMTAVWIGVIGAILLVLMETGGELALGVSGEQTDIAAIMLFSMVGAGIIEEVLFRGYFVIKSRGKAVLVASVVVFSLLFALAHYQYYTDIEKIGEDVQLAISLDRKVGWSLLLLFLNSIWFYTLRFFKWNPEQSLLPCFAAHIASNLAVFLVKLAQGHVTGWY